MTSDLIDRQSIRNRNIVRFIKYERTVERAVRIILTSDWDFKDCRGIMKRDPGYARAYLRELLDGRAVSLQELPPSARGLLCTIVDAWLASY